MLSDVVGNKKFSEKSGVFWSVYVLFGTFCNIQDYEYYVDSNGHVSVRT